MVDVFSEKDVVVAHPSSRVGLIGQKDKLNSSILAVQSGRVKVCGQHVFLKVKVMHGL